MISWIFYYFLILQCLIGALEVVTHVDNHYMIDQVQHESTRVVGFLAICWVMIGLPLGMLVSCSLFKVKSMRHEFGSYCSKQIIIGGYDVSPKWVYKMCLFLSIVSVFSVVYVFGVIHELPFMKFFSAESAVDLALYRQNSNRFFSGNEYVKNILALYLCPIMSYIAYCYYLFNRTKNNLIWWSAMMFCSLAILTFDLSKAPVLVYGIGYIFLYILRGNKISRKALVWIISTFITILTVMYVVIMQSEFSDLLHLNSGFIGRMTLSSVAGVFLSFDLWPSHYDFLGLSSMSQLISSFFGLEYTENSARLIMAYINPSGFYGGQAGMVNALFIGEAYAMFGWIGVVVAPLYVGFLVETVYIFFLRSPKNPFFLGYFAVYSTQATMMGGFGSYLYNIYLVINSSLFLFIYGLGKLLPLLKRKEAYNRKLKM